MLLQRAPLFFEYFSGCNSYGPYFSVRALAALSPSRREILVLCRTGVNLCAPLCRVSPHIYRQLWLGLCNIYQLPVTEKAIRHPRSSLYRAITPRHSTEKPLDDLSTGNRSKPIILCKVCSQYTCPQMVLGPHVSTQTTDRGYTISGKNKDPLRNKA